MFVALAEGLMSNSEVGHTIIMYAALLDGSLTFALYVCPDRKTTFTTTSSLGVIWFQLIMH
jgi:hypothetical protein